MKTFWGPLVVLVILSPAARAEGARDSLETKAFASQPGDTLVIHNDYGRARVRVGDGSLIDARIRTIAADDRHLNNVSVMSTKSTDKVYIHAYFYEYAGESVDIEVQVPRYLNVFISGANPGVEVYGVEGHVRVSTLTGLITAENLTSSVSLLSESGDILFRSRIQPTRDIRLESIHGNVRCELTGDLNLRGWARAGANLSWNGEVEMNNGFIEKQIGIGGPLFYAGSVNGDVHLSFAGSTQARQYEPPGKRTNDGAPSQTADASVPPHIQREAPILKSEKLPPPSDRQDTNSQSTNPTRSAAGPRVPVEPVRTASGAVDSGYSLKVNVDWIYLNVSVRDRHNNRAIPDLQKSDFLLYEDNGSQTIEKFESMEAPFNLLLLLDVSGSTREYIELIKEASIEFTREIKTNDRIAVAVFNSSVLLIQKFTNDRYEVEQTIRRRVRSGGGTAFYDALQTCIHEYMRSIEGRKAIVVFSDGVDNQLTGDFGNGSQTTFDQLYREIQEIDSIIYTIFLDTEGSSPRSSRGYRRGTIAGILGDIIRGQTPPYHPGSGGRGDRETYKESRRQMQLIADQTGGRMYSPRSMDDLNHVYSEIADDLRIQYTLAYSSTNPAKDGRWREIKVKVKNRPDAVARTRKGYYADRGQRAATP